MNRKELAKFAAGAEAFHALGSRGLMGIGHQVERFRD